MAYTKRLLRQGEYQEYYYDSTEGYHYIYSRNLNSNHLFFRVHHTPARYFRYVPDHRKAGAEPLQAPFIMRVLENDVPKFWPTAFPQPGVHSQFKGQSRKKAGAAQLDHKVGQLQCAVTTGSIKIPAHASPDS